MKAKIIGIFVCTLMIASMLPVMGQNNLINKQSSFLERDYGDAPEGPQAVAYPSLGVMGNFPTCQSVGPAL